MYIYIYSPFALSELCYRRWAPNLTVKCLAPILGRREDNGQPAVWGCKKLAVVVAAAVALVVWWQRRGGGSSSLLL